MSNRAEGGQGSNKGCMVRAEAPIAMDGHRHALARWAKDEVDDRAAEREVVRKVGESVRRRQEDMAERCREVNDILHARDWRELVREEEGVPEQGVSVKVAAADVNACKGVGDGEEVGDSGVVCVVVDVEDVDSRNVGLEGNSSPHDVGVLDVRCESS